MTSVPPPPPPPGPPGPPSPPGPPPGGFGGPPPADGWQPGPAQPWAPPPYGGFPTGGAGVAASWGARLGAYLIDYIIQALMFLPVGIVAGTGSETTSGPCVLNGVEQRNTLCATSELSGGAARAGAEGRGVLLTGDTIMAVQDRRWVSFMYSYPNLIPLGAAAIRRIVAAVEPYPYDRLYSAWPGAVVDADAQVAVQRSADRYVGLIAGA